LVGGRKDVKGSIFLGGREGGGLDYHYSTQKDQSGGDRTKHLRGLTLVGTTEEEDGNKKRHSRKTKIKGKNTTKRAGPQKKWAGVILRELLRETGKAVTIELNSLYQPTKSPICVGGGGVRYALATKMVAQRRSTPATLTNPKLAMGMHRYAKDPPKKEKNQGHNLKGTL